MEIFARTFCPSTIIVRFETFGLNTLRVWRWEKETLWPYILPLPDTSQIAILFLLYSVNNLFERFGIIDGEVR